ncbi:MAG: lipopolysaccharide biosynthesis protein, partial [Armatimonadota bacterium]|nr:lipopolysaccharide biosynthesis protein [Armatimonadota bacterium]
MPLRALQNVAHRARGNGLVRRWTGGRFARSVAVLASGTAAGQAISMLAAPALTRLYTAEQFGILAVYLSVFGVLLVIVALQYEPAILLPAEDETAANLVAAALVVVVGVSLLSAAAIVAGTATGLLARYGYDFGGSVWVMPFGVCGAGACQVLTYWALRRNRFARVASTKLAQAIAQVVTQLTLGLLRVGVFGLVAGDALGRVAGTGSLATQAWRQDGELIRTITLRRMWAAAYRYRRFPLFASGAALVNVSGYVVPTLLFAAWYG